MTLAKKRALTSLAIWFTVLIASTLVFFAGAGPAGYTEEHEQGRRLIVAGIFAFGFLTYTTVLWRSRQGRFAAADGYDERDDAVARGASVATLTVVLVFVFVLCITLFEVYRGQGVVPAGWLWFLAYGTSFVGLICHAVVTLYLDARSMAHG